MDSGRSGRVGGGGGGNRKEYNQYTSRVLRHAAGDHATIQQRTTTTAVGHQTQGPEREGVRERALPHPLRWLTARCHIGESTSVVPSGTYWPSDAVVRFCALTQCNATLPDGTSQTPSKYYGQTAMHSNQCGTACQWIAAPGTGTRALAKSCRRRRR